MLLFHLRNHPFPELNRNHFRHITTKTVDILVCPEKKDIQHLCPGVRSGIEVTGSTILIVHSIIQFHGFVPVGDVGISIKTIVPRSLGRTFFIRFSSRSFHIELTVQFGLRDIVKIIIWAESVIRIIICTQL